MAKGQRGTRNFRPEIIVALFCSSLNIIFLNWIEFAFFCYFDFQNKRLHSFEKENWIIEISSGSTLEDQRWASKEFTIAPNTVTSAICAMDSSGHKVAPMPARQRTSVDVDLPDRDSAATGKNIAATVKNTVRRLLRRTKSQRDPYEWLRARTNERVRSSIQKQLFFTIWVCECITTNKYLMNETSDYQTFFNLNTHHGITLKTWQSMTHKIWCKLNF